MGENGFLVAGDGKRGRCLRKDRTVGTGSDPDRHPYALYGRTDTGRTCAPEIPVHEDRHFSGYDDFEYAKQAIKLNVTEYILKPVNVEELTAILQKIKANLDQEIEQKRNVNLAENYIKSLPILREQFLNEL